uniref:Uncharacterized protein n=1 Tax=Candidatus Kentrum sp. LPFa TaxID=2126335 RepID=A0A450WRZ5_9GAMM|nr:MAG: hypothetical protein BECKLPF1236A_GA0070988_102363 [Candidatus Kentron sp. LPFa]VFK34157.1 MAG: hypothetical protein BECKLPF1236C_GA0070990_102483 [Candidatus Kentron sp. LPFa]
MLSTRNVRMFDASLLGKVSILKVVGERYRQFLLLASQGGGDRFEWRYPTQSLQGGIIETANTG